MSNWVDNDLFVSGSAEDVKALLDDADLCRLGLGRELGPPDVELNYNFMTGDEEPLGDMVTLRFDSKNSPPWVAVLALSMRHTRLDFDLRYSEPMMDLDGAYRCKGGEIVCEYRGAPLRAGRCV